jgi:hypothetical protein
MSKPISTRSFTTCGEKPNTFSSYIANKNTITSSGMAPTCSGCTNKFNNMLTSNNTNITQTATTGCTGCPSINTEILLFELLSAFGFVPIQSSSDSPFIYIQSPNGLLFDNQRFTNAVSKFESELPGGEGLVAYIQSFFTTIFEATGQASEELFIAIFFSVILQCYALFVVVISILWIYKVLTPGMSIIWLIIGLIISLSALAVMLVEASRTSTVIAASVTKSLSDFAAPLSCALKSGAVCYIGENCCCNDITNNSLVSICGNAPLTVPFGTITINKNSGTQAGRFFYVYSGPFINDTNRLIRNGTIVLDTTIEDGGTEATGTVRITNLPAGDYEIQELSQLDFEFVSADPSNQIVTVVANSSTPGGSVINYVNRYIGP